MKLSAEQLAKKMLLYAVTDRMWLKPGQTLAQQVAAAIRGGATLIQLREKDAPFDEFLQIAREVKQVTAQAGVPLIINDNLEIMLACDADGLHIGQSDGSVTAARRAIGDGKILGVSAQTVELARKAEADGADYLGVGDIFGSTTKLDAGGATIQMLADICRTVSIPTVAIGGIKRENIHLLAGSGTDGAAVISAIFAQPDAETAARELFYECRKAFWQD